MRFLVAALLVGALDTAHADRGIYISDTFGPASYRGGLRAYGASGMRGQAGIEFRDGDRALYFLGGAVLVDPQYVEYPVWEIETRNHGSWMFAGFDVKQRWPIVSSRYSRIGVRFAVHAGPRYVWGEDALTGYHGLGVNGGASVEMDIGVIGFYVDTGVDVLYMSIPVDSVSGHSPYFSFGAKLGWL
jgi:hypothetical protein